MISYNEMYELVRREKYNEVIQQLPKGFMDDVAVFISEQKDILARESDYFSGANVVKKQLENSIAMFKELMRIRKKKILNLVFLGTETGIMKRDYENLLDFEREVFDKLVKTFEENDRAVGGLLNGGRRKEEKNKNKMVIFTQNVEQFVDMTGSLTGPFASGQLANLDSEVAGIFVSSGKASFVDE